MCVTRTVCAFTFLIIVAVGFLIPTVVFTYFLHWMIDYYIIIFIYSWSWFSTCLAGTTTCEIIVLMQTKWPDTSFQVGPVSDRIFTVVFTYSQNDFQHQ